MTIAKQLFQLQEVDLQIESTEKAIKHLTSQMGESEKLTKARSSLSTQQEHVKDLIKQQRSKEFDADDLNSKISTSEEKLYSGRIHNPKELSGLKQEADNMKTQRTKLEESVLALMDDIEKGKEKTASLENDLKSVEAEWREQQATNTDDLEDLKSDLTELKEKQQSMVSAIPATIIEIYRDLRKNKGLAVAKVEQGICRVCRISLSTTQLQKVRGNEPVRCHSCGRILYAP